MKKPTDLVWRENAKKVHRGRLGADPDYGMPLCGRKQARVKIRIALHAKLVTCKDCLSLSVKKSEQSL